MKILFPLLLFMLAETFYSCTAHNNADQKKYKAIVVKDSAQQKRFANIHFASRFDTSCGMPLAAGIEDTLHYNNKVYGFCSKECKNDFIAKLNRTHKR